MDERTERKTQQDFSLDTYLQDPKIREAYESCRGSFPFPIVTFAEQLGYKVYNLKMQKNFDKLSGVISYAQKAIFINPNENIRRKVFTIAHEVGHILSNWESRESQENHEDYRGKHSYPDGKYQEEIIANNIASELLMPKLHFISQWELSGGDVQQLADFFGVSTQAIAVRACKLKLPNAELIW